VTDDAGGRTWESLRPFEADIAPDAQVLIIAGQGGAKSTLTATLLLDSPSLVALDSKGRLTLPRARTIELPAFAEHRPGYLPGDSAAVVAYDGAVAGALKPPDQRRSRWPRLRGVAAEPNTQRLILRVHPLDVDDAVVHDRIFRAIYLTRPDTITWVDEITGTGASAQSTPRWMRALTARGRTRGQGLWTMTQSPFGLVPPLIRRNADLIIIGSIDRADARGLPFDGAEIAAAIPRKTGRFIVYVSGESEPYRLFVPIPRELKDWKAP
jgi:hypothetical protein